MSETGFVCFYVSSSLSWSTLVCLARFAFTSASWKKEEGGGDVNSNGTFCELIGCFQSQIKKKKHKTYVSWKIKIDSNLFHLFSFLSFFPDNVINLLHMFLFLRFIMVSCCLFSTFCFHFRILKKEQGGREALILMVREKNNKTGQFFFTLFCEEVNRLLSESNQKKSQDSRILENHNRFQVFSSFFFSVVLSWQCYQSASHVLVPSYSGRMTTPKIKRKNSMNK